MPTRAMGNSPESLAPRRSTQRTFNACLRCKNRKARCDGAAPKCRNCLVRDQPCQYMERKTRGMGRSKQRIQRLEERLQSVESLLGGDHVLGDSGKEDLVVNAELSSATPAGAERNQGELHYTTLGSQRSKTLATTPEPSRDDIQTLDTSTPDSRISTTAASSPPERIGMQRHQTQQNRAPLSQTVFASLIPQPYANHIISMFLEDFGSLWSLFDTTSVLAMMDEQYIAGLDNNHENPTRWATINVLLAMAIQWKTDSSSINDLFPLTWKHSKNSFSVFPRLVVRGSDIDACRAVLAMAMFMMGTGDTRAASSLISTASHMSQMLGLHLYDHYLKMDLGEAEKHRRVFWILHIINTDMAMKGGPSPPLSNDYVNIELPGESPPDDMGNSMLPGASLLRYMAQLSLIQTKVLRALYQVERTAKSPDAFFSNIAELDKQLEDWKTELPLEFLPMSNHALPDSDVALSITQLHLTYYATARKLYNAMHHCERHFGTNHHLVKNTYVRWALSKPPWLSPTPIVGARASIHLALHITWQSSLPQLWQTLPYTIAAALVLVAEVLNNPSDPESQSNVDLLRHFVTHVRSLCSRGQHELQEIVTGSSKLYEMALDAVSCSRDTVVLEGTTSGGVDLDSLSDKYKHVHTGLSEATDLMHVSSGLLGNMPLLCAEASNIFHGIFRLSTRPANEFGPLVPAVLQPSHYNFEL